MGLPLRWLESWFDPNQTKRGIKQTLDLDKYTTKVTKVAYSAIFATKRLVFDE
jgi:hypothetical protein